MAVNNAKVLFSCTEDESLVECVAKFPCLFDLANPLYKNQVVKENAWKEVAEFVGRSVEDCKKRWRNIKDTYMKRKKKGKASTGSATTKSKPWPLFEMLSFLEKVDHKRLSTSNIEEQESQDEEETAATESINTIEGTPHSPQELDDAHSTSEAPSTSEASSFTPKRNTPNDSLRSQPSKKQKFNDNLARMMDERQTERAKIINSLTTKKEDEIDVFFRSIAMSVKKFKREIQNEAKLQILKMVIDLEQRNNKPTTNTPQMSLSESNSRSSFFYSPSPPPPPVTPAPPVTPVQPVHSNMQDFYVHAFNHYDNL